MACGMLAEKHGQLLSRRFSWRPQGTWCINGFFRGITNATLTQRIT
jgi:hypothetical protein